MRDWSRWRVPDLQGCTTFPQGCFLVSSQGGTAQHADKPFLDNIGTALIHAPRADLIAATSASSPLPEHTPQHLQTPSRASPLSSWWTGRFSGLSTCTVYLQSLALFAVSAVAETPAPETPHQTPAWKVQLQVIEAAVFCVPVLLYILPYYPYYRSSQLY